MDSASAYEKHATGFLQHRDQSAIGANVVKRWAAQLDNSTEVLEIACGGGYPITRELVNAGLSVWAIDSSASLIEAFKGRFPEVECRCERVLDSAFFDRKFGAVVAVGIVFLLPVADQVELFQRVASTLDGEGRFLFTAPLETGSWVDNNTGLECCSVGAERYRFELTSLGFTDIESFVDSGQNHFFSCKYSG